MIFEIYLLAAGPDRVFSRCHGSFLFEFKDLHPRVSLIEAQVMGVSWESIKAAAGNASVSLLSAEQIGVVWRVTGQNQL